MSGCEAHGQQPIAAASGELLALVQEAAGAGIFDWHVPSGKLALSPKLLSLYGLKEFDGRYETWINVLFREDVARVRDVSERALAERKRESIAEFRIVRPSDGALVWIESRSINSYDGAGQPLRVVGVNVDITERKRAMLQLRSFTETLEEAVRTRTAELAAANARLMAEAAEREKLENRFQLLVEGVSEYALFMLDATGAVTSWNKGAERLEGYRADEVIGQHFGRFYTDEDRAAAAPEKALEIALRTGKFETEGWRVRKDQSRFWASATISPVRDQNGKMIGFAKLTRDTTERREAQLALQRTQEQLAQAQKMEGIGRLTGGVAHDFNNLLTVIIGNLETLQRTLKLPSVDASRLARSAENALRGAQRAAALTERLLAFSRRQPLDPKPLDASRLVAGITDLLRRTLGESIAIETVLAGGLWQTYVDPNQLEVAILNLAVNARDAMPEGGRLTIETANTLLDEAYAAGEVEVVPGQYVAICITDTGHGMTREVHARAFEPFFTTKELGQGTGLGLSQVYGFVKQTGGHVKIYSEVGEGTTVAIYLPRLHAKIAESEPHQQKHAPPRGTALETILLVEDDEDVLSHSREVLRELGYSILEARDAKGGLRVLAAHSEIQLLFTDVGLPGGQNGRQLADAARKQRPDLKVLFTTGYARNAIVHEGRLDPGVHLITKPFTFEALAVKLRDILDERAGPPRVLLVEDEVLVRMLAIEYLESAGYKVEPASSSVEAMNKARLFSLDAAVVDLVLPDRKGDVLVRELHAMYPTLPIVIASGYAESDVRAALQDDGPIAFLAKPYTQERLLATLRSLITKPSAQLKV